MTLVDGRVSVIVRFADPARLPLLDEALFSLALQDHPDLEVVLVLHARAAPALAEARALLEGQPWGPGATRRALAADVPPAADARARLLDLGLEAATGRYVAFLDDDDVVYHGCYTALVGALRASGRAIALGGAREAVLRPAPLPSGVGHLQVERKRWFGRRPPDGLRARLELFADNFAPIHSFLLDRARLGDFPLAFDAGHDRLEDYALLLRLLARFEPDVCQLERACAEYRLRADGSNTVRVPGLSRGADAGPSAGPGGDDALARAAWAAAGARIDALRAGLTTTLTAAELARVACALRALDDLQAERAKLPARLARALAARVARWPRAKDAAVALATRLDRWRARR